MYETPSFHSLALNAPSVRPYQGETRAMRNSQLALQGSFGTAEGRKIKFKCAFCWYMERYALAGGWGVQVRPLTPPPDVKLKYQAKLYSRNMRSAVSAGGMDQPMERAGCELQATPQQQKKCAAHVLFLSGH